MSGSRIEIAESLKQRFTSFRTTVELTSWLSPRIDLIRAIEDGLDQVEEITGYCDCCGTLVPMKVSVGVKFLERNNLREGFLCPKGMSNRQRLLLRIILAIQKRVTDVLLLEDLTPLSAALRGTFQEAVRASIYLGPDFVSGAAYDYRGSKVVHRDMCNLNLADGAVDLVVHSDVLEHIPDFKRALAETRRVLKKGGAAVFTAPWFSEMPMNKVLSCLNQDGTITHNIDPPEYHGDPVAGSILAYYTFGWELLDNLREAGFSDAFIMVEYDAMSGLTSNNNYSGWGHMLPVAIGAIG